MPRKSIVITSAFLALALLAGCTAEVNEPAPEPSLSDAPVVPDEFVDNGVTNLIETPKVVTFTAVDENQVEVGQTEISIRVLDTGVIPQNSVDQLLADVSQEERDAIGQKTWYQFRVEQTYVSGFDPVGLTSYYSYRIDPTEPAFMPFFHTFGFDGCEGSTFNESFATGTPQVLCYTTVASSANVAPNGIYFQSIIPQSGDVQVIQD